MLLYTHGIRFGRTVGGFGGCVIISFRIMAPKSHSGEQAILVRGPLQDTRSHLLKPFPQNKPRVELRTKYVSRGLGQLGVELVY